MIIGNHSAGKSSFINWYVGRDVQKTKVAIETIEINLIMQGNRDTEINGYNAMHSLPFLKELYDEKNRQEKFPGLLENLQLKAVQSQERDFESVLFIDTPGLADGNLKYKFDIQEAIKWFAGHSDVILSFFDPHG